MSGLVQINLPAVDALLKQLGGDAGTYFGGIIKRLGKTESGVAENAAAIGKLQSTIDALQQPAPVPSPSPATQSKTFAPTDIALPRPGAGLFTTSAHLRPTPPAPWPDLPMTVEWYLLPMADYVNADTLPDAFLQGIDDRLSAIEKTPVRAIFRPGPGVSQSGNPAPTTARVMKWMDQIAPIIAAHPGALLATQFGWDGGAWGEEHVGAGITDMVDSGGWVVDQLARHWLSLTPDWLGIQHRRWQYVDRGDVAYKVPYGMFDGPITPEEAFTNAVRARVGGYNDCIADGPLQGAWMGAQFNLSAARLDAARNATTRYTFTAGETCSMGGLNAQKAYDALLATLKLFNLDALNASYWPDMYQAMTAAQLRTLQSIVGARLAVTSVDAPTTVAPGQPINVTIGLQNDGTGKVTIPFGMQLVLIDSMGKGVAVPLLDDVRAHLPLASQKTNIAVSGVVPSSLAPGSYGLALRMPDPHIDTPQRAFPFANDGWDASTGRLNLGMTVIA